MRYLGRIFLFIFAEIPAWPPFWIFKMAAIKYNFGQISASERPILILCFQGQGVL